MTGFISARHAKLASSLDFILEYGGMENPPALAIQGRVVPLTFRNLSKRIHWHCVGLASSRVCGSAPPASRGPHQIRRAISRAPRRGAGASLFPPEQVANLYVGPRELTPAAARSALVNFEEPDFEAFPRFADALEAAQQTEIAAPATRSTFPIIGGICVRALEPFNILVNYWWSSPAPGRPKPDEALDAGAAFHRRAASGRSERHWRDAVRSLCVQAPRSDGRAFAAR